MSLDRLKARWRDGAPTLGAWIMLRDPFAAELAGLAGYDYVCIDTQHGLSNLEMLVPMIQAIHSTQAVPLVRVAANEAWLIGRALDSGALGVIVPLVDTAEQAAAAVAACRFPPDGHRSVGPLVPANRFGPDYLAQANAAIACIPMIETTEALANIDEIVAVPGVDAIYVGPADLSMRLGLPARNDQPDAVFHEALAMVVAACNRAGVVPGIHSTAGLAAARHAAGFRMQTVGFDSTSMVLAFRNDLATAREATATTEEVR